MSVIQKRTFSGRASRPEPEQRAWDPKVSRSQNSIHTTALESIAFGGLSLSIVLPTKRRCCAGNVRKGGGVTLVGGSFSAVQQSRLHLLRHPDETRRHNSQFRASTVRSFAVGSSRSGCKLAPPPPLQL